MIAIDTVCVAYLLDVLDRTRVLYVGLHVPYAAYNRLLAAEPCCILQKLNYEIDHDE